MEIVYLVIAEPNRWGTIKQDSESQLKHKRNQNSTLEDSTLMSESNPPSVIAHW